MAVTPGCQWCGGPPARCDVCDPPPPPPPGLSPSEAALRAGRMWDQLVGLTGFQAGMVLAELCARVAARAPQPEVALEQLASVARDRLALRRDAAGLT